MKRAYVDIPEGQMHYRHAGSGMPVLMLHMSGSHSAEWEKVGDILASKGFSCYAIDMPGFGFSDRRARCTFEEHYSLTDYSNSVISFMDAMGIDKTLFIGNLVGSNIAVLTTLRHPERVLGFQASDFVYLASNPEYKKRKYDPFFSTVIPDKDGRHVMEFWKRIAMFGDEPAVHNCRLTGMTIAGETCEALHWALFEEDLYTDRFHEIKCKAVFLAAEKFNRVEIAKTVASLVSGASFELLEGVSPYANVSHPEKIAGVFLKYFG